MSRAKRRHHKKRMKAKARKITGEIWGYSRGDTRRNDIVEDMVHNCDNLKVCSCDMCCNVRRNPWAKGELTKQELASELSEKEQRDES